MDYAVHHCATFPFLWFETFPTDQYFFKKALLYFIVPVNIM